MQFAFFVSFLWLCRIQNSVPSNVWYSNHHHLRNGGFLIFSLLHKIVVLPAAAINETINVNITWHWDEFNSLLSCFLLVTIVHMLWNGTTIIWVYYTSTQIWFKFIARTLYQIFTPSKHCFVADFNPILRTQVVGGFINHINTKFHTTRNYLGIIN